MPKQYILRNKMWDEEKINRLAKKIQSNAESDRDEALELYQRCKDSMNQLEDGTVETFSKLITACAQALNQMGIANERLLKLAGFLQKHAFKLLDIDAKSPEGQGATGSLFDELKKLNRDA